MENKERTIDTLARYIIYGVLAVVIGALCWTFRSVIVYILIAGVLSLIGQPLMDIFGKIRIGKHRLPAWLCAIMSILLIFIVIFLVVTMLFPIVTSVISDISMANVGDTVKSISVPLQNFNDFLISRFPNLGNDFRIELFVVERLQKILNLSMLSTFLGSVTSFLTSLGIGIFSVVFISFFFFKDEGLFTKIITSVVPDRHETNVMDAMKDIQHLLRRYFLGLLTEVAGVATLNFLGLLLIARMGFNASIGIAVITGMLNIIPYVGPLTGGVIGTALAIVMKYFCAAGLGLNVSFWVFLLIVAAIFCVTQMVDNFLFQPIIYSSSIKAHPLEIFIVLLMAGHIGGIIGMLVAIPSYTVIRVICGKFFRRFKFIRKLIPEETGTQATKNN
ncbi:MAG: AI-2E family transporter [Bacteroidales bacterium]|nr:AI-2E family transporter [Bacteroides sp.]MCM1198725.1 AI-2E family transporter [Clostridium sp.]MCM1501844.1 AI-2E family transporter [Bacteroidales bacterium]